jgi:hypothetical protein
VPERAVLCIGCTVEDREYACPWLALRMGADMAEEEVLEEVALNSDADDLGVGGLGNARMGRASGEGVGVGRKGFELRWVWTGAGAGVGTGTGIGANHS